MSPLDLAPLVGLVVAVGTLLFGLVGLKERLDHDYLEALERRVRAAEERAAEAEQTCARLKEENLDLLRRLLARKQP